MIRWIQRTKARRILVPALTFFVLMIFAQAVLDYHYHGRIRFDFFPHRIVIYLLGGLLIGFLTWRREPSKSQTPPA